MIVTWELNFDLLLLLQPKKNILWKFNVLKMNGLTLKPVYSDNNGILQTCLMVRIT